MVRPVAPPRGRLARNLRRVSQCFFLGLFLWLLFHTELPRDRFDIVNSVPGPVELFFQIDPLHLIMTTLASRGVHAALLWGLVTLGVTLVLGRVFCGWVCPLGALSQFMGWLWRRQGRMPRLAQRQESSPRQRWKYLILGALALGAALGVNQAGLLDPISLTCRSLGVGVIPAFNHGVDAALGAVPEFMSGLTRPIRRWLADHLFPLEPVHFRQGALIGGLFFGILAVSMALPRFWCRSLCPLGALLGLFARHQALRVRTDTAVCTECGLCHLACEGAADPHRPGQWLAHECLMCWNCVPACPSGGIAIRFPEVRLANDPGVDLRRRQLLGTFAAGLLAPPLLRAPVNPRRAAPGLIRPPGALPEPQFLAQCVKCGECMKVCPTNFLQEAGLEAGLEGLWTPVGVGTAGYCSYECSLCGQVCPTGAIRELALGEKKETKIGLAFVDRARCLPWALATPCIVCEEHCPTPTKAIWLEDVTETNRDGGAVALRRPHVDAELCIGCCICVNVCPVVDRPAIQVTSIGESRSAQNRVILGMNDN